MLLVDNALRHELGGACARLGVPLLHVLDPVLEMLHAVRRPGQT